MQKIHLKLKPSKQWITTVFIVVVTTLLLISFLPCSFAAKGLLTIVVMIYSRFLYDHRLNALSIDEDGWQLHEKDQTYSGKLCGDSLVTTWLCVLRFKVQGRFFKHSCVVFRDSFIDHGDYRRLLLNCRVADE